MTKIWWKKEKQDKQAGMKNKIGRTQFRNTVKRKRRKKGTKRIRLRKDRKYKGRKRGREHREKEIRKEERNLKRVKYEIELKAEIEFEEYFRKLKFVLKRSGTLCPLRLKTMKDNVKKLKVQVFKS